MTRGEDEAIDQGRRAFLRGDAMRRSPKPTVTADGVVRLDGPAAIDRSACIAWNGVVCMSCRFACATGAIVMNTQNRPEVHEDDCTACGDCVPVCPTSAIS
jgi:ferredoxin